MDLIIKDVPDDLADTIKEMACTAIERFMHKRDLKVAEAVQTKFETDVDAIRVANGLSKKYDLEAIEPKP